jgi:hypothetical protein
MEKKEGKALPQVRLNYSYFKKYTFHLLKDQWSEGMETYNTKVDSAGNYRRYQLLSYRFPCVFEF